MPGAHNVLNALACIGVCLDAGVGKEKIVSALACFNGIKRRFEILARKDSVTFVEDYGHHPVEIRATINSARSLGGRIVMVFQPHRYSRTRALMSEFATCFGGAGVLVLTEIYAASEEPIDGVSGRELARQVAAAEPKMDIRFAGKREDVCSVLSGVILPGDIVVFQGAGDIHDIALLMSEQYKGGAVGV
jgi:UDP-N-acetylmuramate--alanine ligase